ncbi:DinB family protein [Amycolatopsis sp. H20-H5]|uniref:DinB family protein n=1 Tax=Amycolatopsis sp. H20-H5 TaxID=3046309 RepID=UPI002DB74185|nr:DinB family protein [Amycolatopsis sp. H20-H5]MEC3980629.1 DinB family protein [Amycolatopsis sp. H20-H5]
MAGSLSPTADEREHLLGTLAEQRQALRATAYGLTDEQARASPSRSSLSVAGLIKHVASNEDRWIDLILELPPKPRDEAQADYLAEFEVKPGEKLADVLALLDLAAARTTEVIAGIADLGRLVPVPQGVPWYPPDLEAWSVRWVLFHLIAEGARHAGHADIVREHVDGATALPLLAAAEGQPETPWLKPWSPEVPSA